MDNALELLLQIIANSPKGGDLGTLNTLANDKSVLVWDPTDSKFKLVAKSNITFTGEPPTKLTDLTDTPSSKLGQAGKILAVNEDETAFEYLVLGDVEGVSQSTLDAAIAEANAYAESLVGGQVSPTRIDSWVLGYDSGLTFNPTFNFTIDGVSKSDSRQVTLAAADGTNPRVDVFVINLSTEQIEVLTGTPAANPAEPDVDFSLYLKGPTVDIPAGATTPANIDITTVFDENAGTAGGEWDATNINPDYDYDNAENPSDGTKAIKVVGELVVNQILGFAAGTDIPIADAKEFQFDIQNITTGGAFHITVLGKRSNGRTDSLQLPAPAGFDPANIASYQAITLPISTNQLVSIHEIRFVTEVAGYKFYFDNARFLGGEGTSAPTGDYVTRTEFEALDAEVVKSISTNGGTPQEPDVSGNVDLVVASDVHTEVSYIWNTGESQIFTVADSAKTTDVYVNGSRLSKTDEWAVNTSTGVEVLITLTDGDQVVIISSATATALEDNTKISKTSNIQALWRGTQAQYDALTPDANTLYFIEE